MRRLILLFGVILFLGNGGLAAEPVRSVATSSATATVAHYSYPPPVPPSPYPMWWQKTARFIRYWAQAFGSSAASVFNHPSTAQNK